MLTCVQDLEFHVLSFEHIVTFLKKEMQKLQYQPKSIKTMKVRTVISKLLEYNSVFTSAPFVLFKFLSTIETRLIKRVSFEDSTDDIRDV